MVSKGKPGRIEELKRALDESDDAHVIDWALGEIEEIEAVVKKCADELIAVHNTTGIDVYDRVPGWFGVIRLIYPEWSDPESAYYEGSDYK